MTLHNNVGVPCDSCWYAHYREDGFCQTNGVGNVAITVSYDLEIVGSLHDTREVAIINSERENILIFRL